MLTLALVIIVIRQLLNVYDCVKQRGPSTNRDCTIPAQVANTSSIIIKNTFSNVLQHGFLYNPTISILPFKNGPSSPV